MDAKICWQPNTKLLHLYKTTTGKRKFTREQEEEEEEELTREWKPGKEKYMVAFHFSGVTQM